MNKNTIIKKDELKRICFLKHSMGAGGAERTVAYLANYFSSLGIEIDLVLYGDKGFYPLSDKINILTISKPNTSKRFFHRLKQIIKRFINFHKYVKENKPDVIFCILYPSLIYALPYRRKITLITSERSNPNNTKGKKAVFLRKFLFKKAHGIVFQTQRAKDYYKAFLNEKGVIIPNAVGNENVSKVPEIKERKEKISAVGRICREKDYPTLLRAFSLVNKIYPQYKLEIFGGGDSSALQALAQELGVEERVFFMGAHADALLKIADSKCYVLSSISEGMPNALLEAMAIGLPCISTDCDYGPRELIDNEKNGQLVPVGDCKAMANAIKRFIEDESFANRCGNEAKKIRENNSIENISLQYLDYIKAIFWNN